MLDPWCSTLRAGSAWLFEPCEIVNIPGKGVNFSASLCGCERREQNMAADLSPSYSSAAGVLWPWAWQLFPFPWPHLYAQRLNEIISNVPCRFHFLWVKEERQCEQELQNGDLSEQRGFHPQGRGRQRERQAPNARLSYAMFVSRKTPGAVYLSKWS